MGNRKEEAQEFIIERERERERERTEQSAVGANMMVATVVGLSQSRLVGSTFAQPACFADDIQGGEVQRPADDDQRGGATACYRGDHVSHLSRNRIFIQKRKKIMPRNWNKGPCKAELSVGLSL
jgi:hypothetical protein